MICFLLCKKTLAKRGTSKKKRWNSTTAQYKNIPLSRLQSTNTHFAPTHTLSPSHPHTPSPSHLSRPMRQSPGSTVLLSGTQKQEAWQESDHECWVSSVEQTKTSSGMWKLEKHYQICEYFLSWVTSLWRDQVMDSYWQETEELLTTHMQYKTDIPVQIYMSHKTAEVNRIIFAYKKVHTNKHGKLWPGKEQNLIFFNYLCGSVWLGC